MFEQAEAGTTSISENIMKRTEIFSEFYATTIGQQWKRWNELIVVVYWLRTGKRIVILASTQ